MHNLYIDLSNSSGNLEKKISTFQCTMNLSNISVLVGKSGSGKTSTLRLISGLDYVQNASIKFNKIIWQEKGYFLAPEKRNISFVFDKVNLFPYMNVSENLNFTRKRSKNKISKIFYDELLNSFMIEDLLKKHPNQLSAGESQKVAIAKAFIFNGDIFLLDEPLSSMDPLTKKKVISNIKRINNKLKKPILIVSHSLNETINLANSIAVMENGSVIFNDTINKAINNKSFTNHFDQDPLSILKVEYIEDEKIWNLSKYQFGDEFLYVSNDHGNIKKNSENFFRINAKDVSILKNKETSHSSLNQFSCVITDIEEFIDSSNVLITLITKDKQSLKSSITRKSLKKLNLKVNDEVKALIKTVSIF